MESRTELGVANVMHTLAMFSMMDRLQSGGDRYCINSASIDFEEI